MSTFPLELTDEIIAWIPVVWDGAWYAQRQRYRTLLDCSLVCSAWLPASRHQLFRKLHIDTPERYDLLLSRVLHSKKMRVHLLFVRSVALFTDRPRGALPTFHRRPFVLEFARHLPNLTSMDFCLGRVEAFSSHPSSFLAISRFSTTRTLMMMNCTFPSFGTLRRTLTLLPSLDSLQICNASWPDPAVDRLPVLSHGASTVRRPVLLLLNILGWEADPPSRRCAQQFIAWLSETATSSSLVDLRVSGHFSVAQLGSMAMFGPSLFRFGRGVRKLDIGVHQADSELEMFLCGLTSLETLHLRFDYALQPDTWVQAETLVRSLPLPTQLVDLYISASSYDHGPLEPSKFEGLEALDQALRLELFQRLQAVKLHVEYRKEEGDPEEGPTLTATMLAVMKNKLPQLVARNVIEVSAEVYYILSDPKPVLDVERPLDPNTALS